MPGGGGSDADRASNPWPDRLAGQCWGTWWTMYSQVRHLGNRLENCNLAPQRTLS
jgi:hypothetical protein